MDMTEPHLASAALSLSFAREEEIANDSAFVTLDVTLEVEGPRRSATIKAATVDARPTVGVPELILPPGDTLARSVERVIAQLAAAGWRAV